MPLHDFRDGNADHTGQGHSIRHIPERKTCGFRMPKVLSCIKNVSVIEKSSSGAYIRCDFKQASDQQVEYSLKEKKNQGPAVQ